MHKHIFFLLANEKESVEFFEIAEENTNKLFTGGLVVLCGGYCLSTITFAIISAIYHLVQNDFIDCQQLYRPYRTKLVINYENNTYKLTLIICFNCSF